MSQSAILRTGRLLLSPVSARDLPGLIALKADPRVFATMLGGVRNPVATVQELEADIRFWGAHRVGMFAVYERRTFQGTAGIHQRPDGRGLALRFALWPEARGRGLAREAAGAVLRFAHEWAGLPRVIAVVREDNLSSRMVLGAIGMVPSDAFRREHLQLLVYESRSPIRCAALLPPLG